VALKEKIFKHDDRAEADRIWNYPYAAVEEALANAVYHRSYEPCAPVEVTITPTQLEISSLPGMDRSITDANLKDFNIRSRFYRNRRIGEFLKELDLAEGRNTGIGKIVRAMRGNGSPPPEFYNPETRSFMTVILPIHTAFKAEAEERISPHPAKTMEKSLEGTREKTREKTGEKILRYLAENPAATQNDIVAVIGISVKGVEWNLKTLKESGRLRRVGPDKGGHWEVVW